MDDEFIEFTSVGDESTDDEFFNALPFSNLGISEPPLFKVTGDSAPRQEIADVIAYLYDRDKYMDGCGLVPRTTLPDSSNMPAELDISSSKLFFITGMTP